jgi:23S rRNA (guanosine2251-2'-O)-methyltransferase
LDKGRICFQGEKLKNFHKQRSSTEKSVSDLWIMGKNTIKELLAFNPKNIERIFTLDLEKNHIAENPLLKEIQQKKIPLSFVSKNELFSLVQSDSHQSYVAKIKTRFYWEMKKFLEKEQEKKSSFLLALDSICDPQNMGTILRLAECFQISGVLFSKNRGCDITPVVTKASCGGSELVDLIRVSNLSQSLLLAQKEGYTVITAECVPDARKLQEFSFTDKTVLVLGSEGEGIQPLISKTADHALMIELFGRIDSLNVSQAAAIFLYHWKNSLKG